LRSERASVTVTFTATANNVFSSEPLKMKNISSELPRVSKKQFFKPNTIYVGNLTAHYILVSSIVTYFKKIVTENVVIY
jgi:hypothetical protein